jgi:asparagine synthase (glutamine-hydrolysing)
VQQRFRPPALAGFYDPRGRLDSSVVARLRDVLGDESPTVLFPELALATSAPEEIDTAGDGTVAFEGRLENRATLAERAHVAPTAAAAAVIARLAPSAEASLAELRGSFVVASWNSTQKTGFVAIDQLGMHSLYYASRGDGSIVFASELTVLLGLLPRRPAPNRDVITHWLLELSLLPGRTVFDGVARLPAGSHLALRDGYRVEQYWSPSYRRPLRATWNEAAELLWEQVVASVDAKVDAGDAPAIILSGGIDSSVAAAASVEIARGGKHPASTYSAVFPGDDRIDESARIDALVDALDLANVQLRPSPSGAFALALRYTDTWGLPLPGPGAALEQPLVERAAVEGASVILDGQGGDEVFGRATFLIADRLRHARLISSVRLARSLAPPGLDRRRLWRGTYRMWKLAGLHAAIPAPLHSRLRALRGRESQLPEWFSADARPAARPSFEWGWKDESGPRWWAHNRNMLVQMRDDVGLNEYLRHRAMIVGAEARPPLLDVDLIELVLRLPPELGFVEAIDRPLIREAIRGRVPDAVRRNAVKSNVAVYYHEPLSGVDLAPIRRLLVDPRLEVGAWVDRERVASLVDSPPHVGDPGWYSWYSGVWKLATVEIFLRQQADGGYASRALEAEDVVQPKPVEHRVRR